MSKVRIAADAVAETSLLELRNVARGGHFFSREEADEIIRRVNGEGDEQRDAVIREARKIRDELTIPISGRSLFELLDALRDRYAGLDEAISALDG